jgi:hypothetical protein
MVRYIDGSQSHFDHSHLSLINQIGLENVPRMPHDYCQEVGISISQEQAQQLACPRALTPQQHELMNWCHCTCHSTEFSFWQSIDTYLKCY